VGGFLGSTLWILILSGVWVVRGEIRWGLAGLAAYLVCLLVLWLLLPWRRPKVRIWKLYWGALAPIALSAGLFLWRHKAAGNQEDLSWSTWVFLILILVMPPSFYRKTWEELIRP
jgi:hypothetical protein